MDPQQEIFSTLLTQVKEKGYDVYDGCLPPDGTPYPFVYLADSRMTDNPNKSATFGTVNQTIHIWHNSPRQRGTVSAMLAEIKNLSRRIHYTENFAWNLRNVEQRILTDTTTNTPLLHGMLELEFSLGGSRT